jgi:hypothetical protein
MRSGYKKNITIGTVVISAVILLITGCASLKNLRTSTSIRLDKPPYYHQSLLSRIDTQGMKIGHYPITSDNLTVDSENTETWQELITEMNAFLNNTDWTIPLDPIPLPADEAPELFVGNADMMSSPVSMSSFVDEDEEEDRPIMALYFRNASQEWRDALLATATENNIDAVLFFTIGFSEYFVRQKNWLGKKELALGTGHSIPVKWLTSLDDPVEVIHIMGTLMDKNGKIYRVGAEGIIAAKTASFFESIIGLRNTMTDDAVSAITTDLRREDLPGKPLNYRVALQNLVANLLDRKHLIIE